MTDGGDRAPSEDFQLEVGAQETGRMRTCFDCVHMGYAKASPRYSKWTPGWDAEIYCMKSHWQYDAYNDSKATVRQKLYMAVDCADFMRETGA